MKESCSKCTRREWIGKLLTASGTCALFSPVVSSASEPAAHFDQTLRLRVSDIPLLDSAGGSVKATYNNWATPLMINRGESDAFYVMDPTCTHAGCEVDLYDHGQGMIICPCHWSTFDIAGRVTGSPAFFDLPAYACQYDAGVLAIVLPGFKFGIRSAVLVRNTLGNPRMRLSFPTMPFTTYRVRMTATLGGDFQVVNFSTQIDGALTQMSLSGSGTERQVFVDAAGSSAFYSLELVMTYVP